jgi:dTDP-4-dehydrorhamnose reductase
MSGEGYSLRLLVTGARGMLGSDLVRLLASRHEVFGVDIQEFDITSPSAVREIEQRKPDRVIHLAAYTDVDGCESQVEKSYSVNTLGTRNIALACLKLNAPMLYLSTDYIFDGTKGFPYYEWDVPNPRSIYGKSKWAGEQEIQQHLAHFFIVRTSWLVGKNGKNFVDTILKLAREKETLYVVNDQRGSPTFTVDLARAIAWLIEQDVFGVYHVTNSGDCTWFDFAGEILRKAGLKVHVCPADSRTYRRPAERPSYSVLANFAYQSLGSPPMPSWQSALSNFLGEN